MSPVFNSGDRVLIYCWGVIREGDNVVFSKNGMTMIKRAVKKEGKKLILRGANISNSTDSEDFGAVCSRDIKGKVIAKY